MLPRTRFSLLATLLVVGCAGNPVVTWRPAAVDLPKGRMAMATAKAVALRTGLETKVGEQVKAQVLLNNSLLGLGLLTTGLALGNVHRDAFTGTAYIAGGAYLFGTQNLSKPRLVVYQSGITAVNCALRAVSPLDISEADLANMSRWAQSLEQPLGALAVSIAKVEAELKLVTLLPAKQLKVDLAVSGAKAVLDKAATAVADANDLISRVDLAAGELAITIEQIAEQVNKLASDTVPDPATVSQMIAGLARTASQFAPGLTLKKMPGVDAAASAAPKAESERKALLGAETLALDAAVESIDAAVTAVEILRRPLAARLAAYKGHAASDSLKSCGVSEIVIALRVDTTELQFTGESAQSKFVAVSGGVKPYVARLRESPSGGVEVKSPLPGDSSVDVLVPAKTPKATLHLLVMDGSNPRQTREVTILIGPADSAKPDAALDKTGPDLKSTETAMKSMLSKGAAGAFPFGTPANSYQVSTVDTSQPGQLTITLACVRAGQREPDSQVGVRTALFAQAKKLQLLDSPSIDVQKKLILVSDAKCLTPAV